MQFAEGLSDRQAAEAVRIRSDWKYALNVELNHPGFDFSVLCEFRARLLAGHAEQLLFETMLDQFKTHGLLKARGHQRTDSTHILAAIRILNRLECVGETMRHALEALAVVVTAWLLQQVRPEWKERYEQRIQEYRLPASKADRQVLAETIGTDGFSLTSDPRRSCNSRLAAGGPCSSDPASGLDPTVLCSCWSGPVAQQR